MSLSRTGSMEKRPAGHALLMSLGVWCVFIGLPGTAAAVTVLLESGDAVRGLVVRENAVEIVIDEIDVEGKKRRRNISMEDVAGILRPVNKDRLAALKPSQPKEYRLYAEELAEKHADPEARAMAIRLYLIAAYLSPGDLGRPCLLGMASIAASPNEEKRYRGMAYLLDRGHDPRLLQRRESNAKVADSPNEGVLRVVRLLRSGKRSEAMKLIERDETMVAKLQQLLPPEHAKSALSRVCIHCTKGYVTCPRCGGSGKTASGDNCPDCRVGRSSRGKKRCLACGGKYASPEMTRGQLVALVKAELTLFGGARPIVGVPAGGWQHQLAEGPPARPLDLRTITPYDPTLCVYRNQRWVTQ